MTREYLSNKIDVICSSVFGRFENKKNLLDQIFDEKEALEAQLKAKESDLERQDMIIKCLNIDLDNKEKLLKAKDEEIKELGEIVQQYLITSKKL